MMYDAAGLVSIHAPAWGATTELLSKPEIIDVSIHAPAWGATLELISIKIVLHKFQSTRPRGARL